MYFVPRLVIVAGVLWAFLALISIADLLPVVLELQIVNNAMATVSYYERLSVADLSRVSSGLRLLLLGAVLEVLSHTVFAVAFVLAVYSLASGKLGLLKASVIASLVLPLPIALSSYIAVEAGVSALKSLELPGVPPLSVGHSPLSPLTRYPPAEYWYLVIPAVTASTYIAVKRG